MQKQRNMGATLWPLDIAANVISKVSEQMYTILLNQGFIEADMPQTLYKSVILYKSLKKLETTKSRCVSMFCLIWLFYSSVSPETN